MYKIQRCCNLPRVLRTARPEPLVAAERRPILRGWHGMFGALLAVIMLTLVLLPQAALAAWTQATGTSGIRFISMSKIGTTIYAGALAGGLYQSTDDGATWTAAFGATFSGWSPQIITQIGSVLYVGGNNGSTASLAYSVDAGTTWNFQTSWGSANTITDVALMNGATFAAAYGKGVYKSTANDGTGWALSNTGMTSQSGVKKLAQIGTDIFVADASNNGSDGVYKSVDSGLSWTRVSSGLPATGGAVSGLINYNGTLFFAMGNGVWRSMDSGASWSQVNANNSYAFVNNNATLYLSLTTGLSLLTSTDGTTWTSQSLSGITASYLQPGIVVSGGKLMLASGNGIWLETDPAPSYSLTITPPNNGSVASNTGGISCGSTCTGYYVSGASVTLTATANSGYTFSSWGGDCAGTTNPLTLTVAANTACSATFAPANTAPAFVGGTTTLAVAQSASATDIKSLLHVSDTDSSQTLTWTQSSAPAHGTLNINAATANSGSTDITPGGTMTYTPTAGYVGSDNFTIQVSDGTASTTRTINVTVGSPAIIVISPSTLNSLTVGAPVSQTITASGGYGAYTYSIAAGALPPGLTLSSGGLLSGTPTTAGTYNFTVQATDSSTGTGPFNGLQTLSGSILPSPSQAGIPTLASGVTATLSVVGCSGITNSGFIHAPAGAQVSFPFGLLGFTLTGCATGGTATVTVTYSRNLPPGAAFYKYLNGNYATYNASLGTNSVTFTLTDGGSGDADNQANASISDPGGIGVPPGAQSIPVLSEWGLIILSSLMAWFGMMQAKRRREGMPI